MSKPITVTDRARLLANFSDVGELLEPLGELDFHVSCDFSPGRPKGFTVSPRLASDSGVMSPDFNIRLWQFKQTPDDPHMDEAVKKADKFVKIEVPAMSAALEKYSRMCDMIRDEYGEFYREFLEKALEDHDERTRSRDWSASSSC